MNEAELLFSEVLKTDRLSLCLNKDALLGKSSGRRISSVLQRRIKGEPIQYILGKTEFMGLDFLVSPAVLIPRPETEILVEKAIEIGIGPGVKGRRIKILDVGTGSGCIAVSLAKFLPEACVYATDISPEALETARQNAILNKVNVDFSLCDLFAPYAIRRTQYDIVISNPPYIISSEINRLQPEIQYEPRIALDGGADGLDFYRRMIERAPAYLLGRGYLVLEIGFAQAQAIKIILENSRKFEIIEVVQDYNKIDRVIVAKKK